ncbi:hypothetical protein KY290_018049 [Solanum tuberosum]|uniref:Retrotransposon gag domain-containing protein n=1 Tax=Solanum tuberosum TaxID=4113 RepID=A0ABQ7VET2_SOLTU|nr:hypothetical protein KY285_017014 [Solanum tuberosum]KAH0761976.1 hypothetical protein KY290_018049 [Solanum tuberosum]
MEKSARANESSSSEVRELREMMQKMLLEIGTLAKKVSNLQKLDQVVLEIKELMASNGANQRDKIPTGGDKIPVGGWQLEQQSHSSFGNQNSHYPRGSTMEFLKFSEEDLRSWLFRIDQFFHRENIPMEEKISIAALQLEGEAVRWHLSFMKYRQYIQPPTWNEYVVALVERFGADSPKKLVSFEFSNLSHFYPQETSIKKASYTSKVLDEMPKRDLDIDFLFNGITERNNKTEAFEDLFCDAFFIDNESDIEAFENMHLGWLFLNNKSDMDTTSLDSDWKEVLSWQAHSDTILSKIMTSCNLWLNLESNKKTCQHEEIEKSLFLIADERPILIAEEKVEVWMDGFLSLSTWDVIGSKKAIMLRMRMYDHMWNLVNCHSVTHLEVINYQISSSYFTLGNKGDLKGKGCTQFPLLQFSASSLGKTSSTYFGRNMENGGNQLFMFFHSPGPLFRNTSLTVEVTAPSGKNERPFAVINSSGQTHECCGNGFNLGAEGGKMSKRSTAKDHLKSQQHCESIDDGSRSRSQQIMLLGNSLMH